MIENPYILLGEATTLAHLMVSQIEIVDLYDPVTSQQMGESVGYAGRFCREMTEHVGSQRMQDQLHKVIDRIAGRFRLMFRLHPSTLNTLCPEEVVTAAKIVSSAIKGVVVSQDRNNAWLAKRRLLIKFSSIPVVWVDDGHEVDLPEILEGELVNA